MSDRNNFFDELYEWSARKHSLMRKYVDGAARYLSSIPNGKTLYYVDGFAGKGRYGNPEKGVPYQDGSPLIMAELAKQHRERGYTTSIRCINVEVKQQNFETLCETTASYGDLVTNLQGEFSDHIDKILDMVKGQPVVAFLDPFGIKGLSMESVARILGRHEPTDVWIRFDVGEVRRRCGWYNTQNKGREAHFGILQDIYGIKDAETLYKLLEQSEDVRRRKYDALNIYRQQLMSKFPDSKNRRYAASYRIGSLQDEEKYFLVFAAAKEEAICLASDLISGEREAFEQDKEHYATKITGQMSLLAYIQDVDPKALADAKVADLAEFVAREYSGQHRTRKGYHLALCLNGWFGKIKKSELTAAFNLLIKQNKAELIADTGTISDPKAKILIK